MDAKEVIQEIESAFAGTPRSQISLRQFNLTDKKGLSKTITDEEWREAGRNRADSKWEDITDTELEEFECMLPHMQAAEFRYFLPAYMRYAARNAHKPFYDNVLLGSTIFNITPESENPDMNAYTLKQLSLLSDTQIKVVKTFLEFASKNAENPYDRTATAALEKYWATR